MPEYDKLRDEIQELFGMAQEIGSTVDVDHGRRSDDRRRRWSWTDWLLKIDNDEPRRQIVKCQVEKQGKKWKITALEPVEFFQRQDSCYSACSMGRVSGGSTMKLSSAMRATAARMEASVVG